MPQWNAGDTQSYFITESELLDQERLSLEITEIDLIIKKLNKKRAILEGHLRLNVKEGQGKHWKQFYKRLYEVPFTFYLDFGGSNPFDKPVQVANSNAVLKQVLTDVLAIDGVQPVPYNEIQDWLGKMDDATLPNVLLEKFKLLNSCFSKYGNPTEGLGEVPFVRPDICGDSTINTNWVIRSSSHYPHPDTLFMSNSLETDSTNAITAYRALAKCGLLEGLDDTDVMPDTYHYSQEKTWSATTSTSTIVSNNFIKKIDMTFGEMKTSRSWEIRVAIVK